MNLISKENRNAMGAKLAVLGVGAGVMVNNTVTALATNPFANAENTITDLFESLTTTLTNVAVPIAGCALVFCLLMMLFSTSQRKVETYRGWAITIFLCIVGIFAVNFVIDLAQDIGKSLAASGGTGG